MSFSIDDLHNEAARLGFTLSGIARPDPPAHFPVFESWLAKGRHAGMGYLATARARAARSDLNQILPEVRSVLSLAMRYPDPRAIPAGPEGDALGRVASYAWGDDYHLVIPGRLRMLVDRIAQETGALQTRVYTDTGPVLERDLAQRAGLGWAGKNTCLINLHQGSYFFLAEVLLDRELEPTLPVESDFCGSCRRCIDVCPTDCILPDRTIDAARCISYLTIENKGMIATELRSRIGEWVFGCDICQEVCPWNQRFSDPTAGMEFRPRPEVAHPLLRNELHLSPPEFNHKFKNSPIQRARRRGYLRNVAVALGNARDRAALPDLARVLEDEIEPLVRSHAAWALGQIAGSSARHVLERALNRELDETVRGEISAALSQ